MLRVLHFSDVHVDVAFGELPVASMFNKRLLGAANLLLRRKHRFADARQKLEALAAFARDQHVDLVVSTGDFTALGTHPELRSALEATAGLRDQPLGFVAVPGNHDVYMPDTIADGRFEQYFGEFARTDLPELSAAGQGAWPFVRLFGDELAVVGINSARPNPQPWRSSGRIPDAQLTALPAILADARVQGRFVLVLTHYAPRRADGSHDDFSHGLENADELLAACRGMGHGALLHGHIHERFHLEAEGVAVFGAGSTTDGGKPGGLWLFELEDGSARAVPGRWEGDGFALCAADAVDLSV